MIPASSTSLYNVFAGLNKDVYVIVGGDYRGLYRSRDDGEMWMDSGLPIHVFSDFTVDESGRILVATQSGKVYAKDEWDDTWIDLTGNLPEMTIDAVAIAQGGTILVGSRGDGMFQLRGIGQNWTSTNVGLQNLWIPDIAVDNGGRVYAGTAGGGVFRTDFFISTEIESQSDGELKSAGVFQVYPNPVLHSATIHFTIENRAETRLSVFNVLGQQVSVLLQQDQPPGSYSVEWHPGDMVGNGAYLVVLEVEGNRRTLLVVRLK